MYIHTFIKLGDFTCVPVIFCAADKEIRVDNNLSLSNIQYVWNYEHQPSIILMSWRVGRVEVSRHNLQMFFCFVTDSFCDNLNKTLHLATKWKNNLARHIKTEVESRVLYPSAKCIWVGTTGYYPECNIFRVVIGYLPDTYTDFFG